MAQPLDAYRTDDGQVAVWCDHERRWHWHGGCDPTANPSCPHGRRAHAGVRCTCPPGTGDGHRVAHCACPASPYRDGGYVLREVGPFTAAVRRDPGRRRSSHRCPALTERETS